MKHKWSTWKFASGDIVACNSCGIVKNDNNADNDNCRGEIKIGFREGLINPSPNPRYDDIYDEGVKNLD